MMTMIRMLPLGALLLALPASAQDAAEPGRFVLDRLPGGIVRLDTHTGAMSLCTEKDGALICRMGADERSAYEEQLDLLEKRVAALEGKVASGDAPASRAMPSEEEMDRSIGMMERFMRSFFGLIREFESEKAEGGTTN